MKHDAFRLKNEFACMQKQTSWRKSFTNRRKSKDWFSIMMNNIAIRSHEIFDYNALTKVFELKTSTSSLWTRSKSRMYSHVVYVLFIYAYSLTCRIFSHDEIKSDSSTNTSKEERWKYSFCFSFIRMLSMNLKYESNCR
jgi:hypothetical protein